MASSASLGPCSLSHSQRSEQRWPCPHSACPVQLPPISSRLVAWERRGGTHMHTHTPPTRLRANLPAPNFPCQSHTSQTPRQSGEFSVMFQLEPRGVGAAWPQ